MGGTQRQLRRYIEGVPEGKNDNQRNATALANELVQSEMVVNGDIRNQEEANTATEGELTGSVPIANRLINDKNKPAGKEKPEDYVDRILRP
ncbi:MAG: hypothetical protein LC113_10635 [Acidobacteria bacterium]|nr:hypothetical protein [Acidobacteriota bacterium]